MALDHVHLDCPRKGCFGIVTVHRQEEARLRQTHESFYCPAGHSMSFSGPTKEEKRLKELEGRVERLRENLREAWRTEGDTRDTALDLVRGLQVCPLGCGWHGNRRLTVWGGVDEEALGRFFDRAGGDLREHLEQEHGAEVRELDTAEA